MMTTSRPGGTFAVLNLLGAVSVGYALWSGGDPARPLWAAVLAAVAVVSWALRGFVALFPRGERLAAALGALAALSGGLAAGATHGLTVVPAAIGTLAVLGTVGVPLGYGTAVAVLSGGAIALGAVAYPTEVPDTLTMMGGVLLAAVGGYSRRQFRTAEVQAALLRERESAMRQEAERVAIARDLHDVLAHSLGGLVIQLDAAEALLESGDRTAAAERVAAARRLAADGLGEARRAVATLRDPARADPAARPGPGESFTHGVERLLQAHRSLGGVVDFSVCGAERPLRADAADAVLRALQEALSNVRKHAPGQPVRAGLDWQDDTVILTVSNPLADTGPLSEDPAQRGYGLIGMRERFDALGRGSAARAGVRGDRFVVTAEAVL
ncbi:sensor histidine kinase [Arthrobacter sp. RAF14]|uniref:sensor histidine kinase n=1 Tax=Arthrobacter sp. RAF14 TaxID=3233051 RepID=UPI003F921B74